MQILVKNKLNSALSVEFIFEGGPGPAARIARARLTPGAQFDLLSQVSVSLDEVNNNAQVRALLAKSAITVTPVEQTGDNFSVSSQINKLRNDVANAWANVTTVFHKVNPASVGSTLPAVPTDLPTVITFVNALKVVLNQHLPSAGDLGAHRTASATSISSADATDQTTANTLINEEKADYNTHLTESGVHINNDATNNTTAANATDLATSITLATELRTDYLAHTAAAVAMDSLPMGNT